nr:MAG TPA: hypothetical protein [Caudoviricetes sp.]
MPCKPLGINVLAIFQESQKKLIKGIDKHHTFGYYISVR